MNSAKKIRSYTAGEKLKMIQEAEISGNRAVGRKYNVSESCIRDWRKNKDKLQNCSRNRMAFRGKQAKYPEIEERLRDYIKCKRQFGFAVSTEMCQLKAIDIAKELNTEEFKASRGWVQRFYNRHGFSIRRKTSICQRLPDAYADKVAQFQRHIIRLREKNSYSLSQIGNADQTPVFFDMPLDVTVESKGQKSIPILTSGNEKQRCTVMLTVLADGKKLPPFIVFKRKTLPKGMNFPRGIKVRAQEKGWMDNHLVMDWINCVWEKRAGALLRSRNMLVLDSFRGHTMENVKERLRQGNTDTVIIPGGCTSLLQPLDVCINRPFKTHLRRLYTEWMATAVHETTPTGRVKKPELTLICEWIITVWDSIPENLVINSFKKCCISNASDGSEDFIPSEGTTSESSAGEDSDN
jgi:hypothetical protein